MSFKVLCLLILLNSLQTNARGRVPIPTNSKNNNNSTEHLDLPRGFDPQSPPTNPLLYPFVTEQPTLNISTTTSGWRPIVTEGAMTRNTALMPPLLQARISSTTEMLQEVPSISGPVLEAIVYGAWKPEPPLQPNSTLAKNEFMDKFDNGDFSVSLEKVMRGKLGGFIEEIGNKNPILDTIDKSASNESAEDISTNKKQFNKKMGRRKIIATKNSNQSNESQTKSTTINSMEVLRVNSTDPALLNMIKQINESVEENNKPSKRNQKSTEYVNSSQQISKEWPTDFLNSPEIEQTQENSMQNNLFNYMGDSSEPPQATNGLYGAETKATTAPINITKMGVPFESQNSDEGPSICVPLAIREPSVSNPAEIIEVERVYCFPLPSQEIKPSIETINETLTFDKDAEFNVLSYEELLGSSASGVYKNPIWMLSLSFLFIK